MKKILFIAFFISAVMVLLPLSKLENSPSVISASAVKSDEIKIHKQQSTSFKVYITEEEKTVEIDTQDYIFGVVAAEMPALYETEALKAQAVAAFTFACRRKYENSDKEYDITNDHTTDQSYITKAQAKERWGEKADEYIKKIEDAVSETSGYIITHDNSPITAVYHAISSGKTESAENIWDADISYLVPVSSEGDKLANNYISEVILTKEELSEKLSSKTALSGEPNNFFNSFERTQSGTVLRVDVCGNKLKGSEIRSLLNLRSSNFSVEFKDEKFVFSVYGYGHGVGMSQNGANYMAKQGCSFKEILTHYYTGCAVEKVKNYS